MDFLDHRGQGDYRRGGGRGRGRGRGRPRGNGNQGYNQNGHQQWNKPRAQSPRGGNNSYSAMRGNTQQRNSPAPPVQYQSQAPQQRRSPPPPSHAGDGPRAQQYSQRGGPRGAGNGSNAGRGRDVAPRNSVTPDRIPPKKNIEGVLECAPPLTVVETRTAQQQAATAQAGGDTGASSGRKSYSRDRRGAQQQQTPSTAGPPQRQTSQGN